MFFKISSLLFVSLLPVGLFAAGGDFIRSKAPVTALVFDLKEGNLKPLERAYFNDEIDFFLDYKGVSNSAASDLYNLREAGQRVARGDVVGARNYLRQVQSYADERQYVEAVIQAAESKFESASITFKNLIERRRKISRRLLALSFLGAARVAHEVGDYKQAIFYYSRVPQLDPLFFQSVFEKGWSFYLWGDMNGALGSSLTFTTPYAENVMYPEALIYRAAAFYHLCLFDRANETIETMKKIYVPVQAQVQELRRRNVSSWLFDENVLSSVDKRVLGYMVADKSFRSLQRAYSKIQDEPSRLSGDALLRSQEAEKFIRARLIQEGSRVLTQLDQDMSRALEQADQIQIEILQLGVNVLVGAPIELRDDIRIIKLGDVDFSELVQFWPFKKEFWADEIGNYYYGLKSACQ